MIRSKLFWPSLFTAAAIIYCCTVIVYDTVSTDALLYGLTSATMAHLFTVALVMLTFLVTALFFVFTFKILKSNKDLRESVQEINSKMWHKEMEFKDQIRKLQTANRKPKTKKKP